METEEMLFNRCVNPDHRHSTSLTLVIPMGRDFIRREFICACGKKFKEWIYKDSVENAQRRAKIEGRVAC